MTNIFITGGTGFLGWEMVKTLLEKGHFKLYLLVRRKENKKATKRITDLVSSSYGKNMAGNILNRIKVIEGDIVKKDLGINKRKLEELSRKIDTIYHFAALCEFGAPLETIREVNVTGTKNILELALKCRKKGSFKSFHHISTAAVAGKSGGKFYEDSLDIGQKFNNTYEKTKFEAEKLIEKYRKKGLSIPVYRPSIVTGSSITGEVLHFQMLYQHIHIFSLGIFEEIPVDKRLRYDLVPVDYVTKAIYLISLAQDNNKNYHLTNPNTIPMDVFLNTASSYFGFKGPRMVSEKMFDFKSLTGYRRKLLESYMPYLNHKELVFDNSNFRKAVNGRGFSWPKIDRGFLNRLFKYCAETGYIRRRKRIS